MTDTHHRHPFKPKRDKTNDKELVFGIHPVTELIEAGKELDRVLVQKDLTGSGLGELISICRERKIPVLKVPPEKLNRLTTKKHQGVIGFMAAIQYASLDHIISTAYSQGKDPFVLILDRVTDVRNFGAIARTAECFGVHALVVSARGGARIGGDAMKTSAGALSHIPVCREMSLTGAVHFLKSNGLSIVACTEKAEVSLIKTDMSGPLAIVLGSEEDGISEEVLQLCDQQAQIPMQGRIASLNVSVAAGIILYQATSQR